VAEQERPLPSFGAFILVGAALYGAYCVREALTPFVLAAAFAYVLNPAVTFFEAKGFKRLPVIVAGYLAALVFAAAGYYALKPIAVEQGEHLIASAPAYAKTIQRYASGAEATLVHRLPVPPKVSEKALDSAIDSALGGLQDAPSTLLAVLPILAHALLVPFIGFFFLMDSTDGLDGLVQATPSRYVEQTIHLMSEIDTALGNYLRGLIIVAIAIGTATFFGLTLLGVENAFAISILCGITSVVPYMGVVIGIIVGGGMALIQFGTFLAAGKVLALFVGIRLADEILLQPVIARHSVHMHPMANLLALVLGGEMFGFLGLVFAVPAACVIKALVSVAWSWYASESGLEGAYTLDAAAIPYT
jgi:predicted PurR-regulated permease PerM